MAVEYRLPFPGRNGAEYTDEDGTVWAVSFRLFDSECARPLPYRLVRDDESDNCPDCLRGVCIQRIVKNLGEDFDVWIHGAQDQLN